MLEPSAIRSYRPPLYRDGPPSYVARPPAHLPFTCVVLESVDARGGPAPALLHSIRKLGCFLVLARRSATASDTLVRDDGAPADQVAPLHDAWFDAVFDEVINMDVMGKEALEEFFTREGILPAQALCFASSEEGARTFAAADAGLIVASAYRLVAAGADIAARDSPSTRQLAWFHDIVTAQLWCTCMWLAPAMGEFSFHAHVGDAPSIADRATLSAVGSPTMTAGGHAPWVRIRSEDAFLPCTVKVGKRMVACPDWTPLAPQVAWPGSEAVDIGEKDMAKIVSYCHSLDVGIAQVNHTVEAEGKGGIRLRVFHSRFVNLAMEYQAAAQLSITLTECNYAQIPPSICACSRIGTEKIDQGFEVRDVNINIKELEISATYVEASKDGDGKAITVLVRHTCFKDDGKGKGDERVDPSDGTATVTAAPGTKDGLLIVFHRPHRGTRYTVHKMVSVFIHRIDVRPPTRPETHTAEVVEEHRAAWCDEWDKADLEIGGSRQAMQCQRAARLFRYHQISQGDIIGVGRSQESRVQLPHIVENYFRAAFTQLFVGCNRPGQLLKKLLLEEISSDLHAPDAKVYKIRPHMPPACHMLRFNIALGGRWHRFTVTPGNVQILMQGLTLERSPENMFLRGDVLPLFRVFIGNSDDGEQRGVLVQASPWQEVQVQHALTEMGCPDGSAGGFYGLMRRTRFVRSEVVRIYFSGIGDCKELVKVLKMSLARLRSVPRPLGWKPGQDENMHVLVADTTRVRVSLKYEKMELMRDITFLGAGDDKHFCASEEKLLALLQKQHQHAFPPSISWVDRSEVPPWDDLIQKAVRVLETAASGQKFRNFITDRDGTTNNYCDRYASSVQSVYNAVWLVQFARHCTKTSIFITAAPLGGRPSTEGLMEKSVMRPHGVVTYAGSKGREFFDHATQRVAEVERLHASDRELMEELHRRLVALCAKPGNSKFLGIGSGLQRKFGEVTMARNDPAGTIAAPESKRFMSEVRAVKDELDPEGNALDLHDTGTDMELFPRTAAGGRPTFDKGTGVMCLNEKLSLNIAEGPNLVCGDTGSDVAMIEAVIKLMAAAEEAGEDVELKYGAACTQTHPIRGRAASKSLLSERQSSPQSSETEWQRPPANLAVLFVISPEQHSKTPNLAAQVEGLCRDVGAPCAIVPSPDILVAAVALYAKKYIMNAFSVHSGDLELLAEACSCSVAKLQELGPQDMADAETFAKLVLSGKCSD